MGTKIPQIQPRQRQPRLDLSNIFRHIFSNGSVANWLLCKDIQPPSISPDIMNRAFSVTSILTSDSQTALTLLRRSNAASYPGYRCDHEDNEDGSPTVETDVREQKRARLQPQRQNHTKLGEEFGKDLVFVCHGTQDTCCFTTTTDDRSPLSFMELPGIITSGVRRSVGMKLDNGYVLITYIWLEDGRSTMKVLYYSLGPELYAEKHFVLLNTYPACRYPRTSDILETLVTIPELMCQYCNARDSLTCVCDSRICTRATPSLPALDQRDPWALFVWCWLEFEVGLKRYRATLSNLARNVTIDTSIYHHAVALFTNAETRIQGFHRYLDKIASRFNSVIYDYQPSPLLMTTSSERRPLVRSLCDNEEESDCRRSKSTKRRRIVSTALPQDAIIQFRVLANPSPEPIIHLPVLSHFEQFAGKEESRFEAKSGFGEKDRRHEESASHSVREPQGSGADVSSSSFIRNGAQEVKSGERQEFQDYLAGLNSMSWTSGTREPCIFCSDRVYTRKHDLKRHIRSIHLGKTGIECSVCGIQYTRKSHLDAHYASVHSQRLDFICSFCSKGFASESLRKKHMVRVHNIQESGVTPSME